MTALAIAELSTTEAFAACTSCLLCRDLFPCVATVRVRDCNSRVQRRCLVGHLLYTVYTAASPELGCSFRGNAELSPARQVQLAAVPKLLPPPDMACSMQFIAACEVQGRLLAGLGQQGDRVLV